MRGFLEGGIILLVAYYQEGMHHRDPHDRENVRNWLKEEFNGELITIAGAVRKIGKSAKGAEGAHRFHRTEHDLACRELPATNRGN